MAIPHKNGEYQVSYSAIRLSLETWALLLILHLIQSLPLRSEYTTTLTFGGMHHVRAVETALTFKSRNNIFNLHCSAKRFLWLPCHSPGKNWQVSWHSENKHEISLCWINFWKFSTCIIKQFTWRRWHQWRGCSQSLFALEDPVHFSHGHNGLQHPLQGGCWECQNLH